MIVRIDGHRHEEHHAHTSRSAAELTALLMVLGLIGAACSADDSSGSDTSSTLPRRPRPPHRRRPRYRRHPDLAHGLRDHSTDSEFRPASRPPVTNNPWPTSESWDSIEIRLRAHDPDSGGRQGSHRPRSLRPTRRRQLAKSSGASCSRKSRTWSTSASISASSTRSLAATEVPTSSRTCSLTKTGRATALRARLQDRPVEPEPPVGPLTSRLAMNAPSWNRRPRRRRGGREALDERRHQVMCHRSGRSLALGSECYRRRLGTTDHDRQQPMGLFVLAEHEDGLPGQGVHLVSMDPPTT